MNQLKHLMGIPITLPNGLALRGSTFSRSAGTNGRHPKRSGKLLVVTGDDDESVEPKLSSKSYARIIEDYSKAIEARNAAAKLNGEAKNKNRGFFSKAPFQRLARVSSLVNIKNSGNNGGSNLCTESSSRPPNSIKASHKSHRSKSGFDGPEILHEVDRRAEWLDHVVKAHNVKKTAKNDNFANDSDHGKNKAHNLVQRLPESRATRNATPSSFNDSCSPPVKKSAATPASDVNSISKTSKTGMKILKSMSDTSVQHSLSVKGVTDNSATVVNKMPTKIKAENTIPKNVSDTSVHKNVPSKKLQDNSISNLSNTPKKNTSESTITKSISNTSVHHTPSSKKLPDYSKSEVNSMSKRIKPKTTIAKSISNTSVHKKIPDKKLPDNLTHNVNNTSKTSKPAKTISKITSDTSVHHNMTAKKISENSAHDINKTSKKSKPANTISKITSDTSVHHNMSAKKISENSAHDLNNTSKKNKPANTIWKSTSDTSIHHNISAKKISENSAHVINNMPPISKRNKTRNAISKSMSDKSLHQSLSAKKLSDNSTRDANIISSKSNTGKTIPKSCSNPVDRYCSAVERMSRTSASTSRTAPHLKNASNLKTVQNLKPAQNLKAALNAASNAAPIVMQRLKKTEKTPAHTSSGDTNVGSNKSNTARNVNQRSFNNSVDRSYSSVERQPHPSTSDMKNISVIVQRLPKTDKVKELSKQNSQDANMMLVTVTESSKSSSTSKSCPLRHIDLRINGKPAAEVDNVISKVDKLGVVSSAEKIEITIPILSNGEEADGDNLRAPNSTINLCISSQAKESTVSNKVGHTSATGERIHSGGRSKSCLTRPTTRITSTMKNVRRPGSSNYRSKVIPWWTSADSFRRSEVVSARSTKAAANTTNGVVRMSRVEQSSARVNQEVQDWKPKKVAFSEVRKAPSIVVAKPSSSRQQLYRRKRASAISKAIANEAQKKMERDEQERLIRKQLTLERLKSYAKPEAKPDMKVKSMASNLPKMEPVAIDSTTMPRKIVQAKTATPDSVTGKTTSLPKSTITASVEKSITVEIEPDKTIGISKNNNVSNANNFQARPRVKPISEIVKGKLSASKNRKAASARQNSESRPVSKIAAKLRQEVTGKSETNTAPQFPRTYGKIRLLPSSQTVAKPGNRENNSSEPVKPSTDDKLSKLKNATITMKPIEKKKDGTLIDYGVTVNTRKKPERKLSGLDSATGLQGKKLVKQKETAVVASVKEVMPRRNRDTRSSTINPRGMEDSSRSRIHALDKNVRPTSETRMSPSKAEDTASKGTTNELNESANLETSVKSEKRDSEDSNQSPVIETASAADKRLVYSVWLRRFKERSSQDSDPTKDPSSRKP